MMWVSVAHAFSPLGGIPTMYPFLAGVHLDHVQVFRLRTVLLRTFLRVLLGARGGEFLRRMPRSGISRSWTRSLAALPVANCFTKWLHQSDLPRPSCTVLKALRSVSATVTVCAPNEGLAGTWVWLWVMELSPYTLSRCDSDRQGTNQQIIRK